MKKTIILFGLINILALPVTASAWTVNGKGGAAQFTGQFIPQGSSQSWEVKLSSSVVLGDYTVTQGETSVSIPVTQWYPILGIRTTTTELQRFGGAPGISPQIDFNGAVDIDNFNAGETTMVLPVVNRIDNSALGTLTMIFSAGAEYSWQRAVNTADTGKAQMFASSAGQAFYGGLPKSDSKIVANAWYMAGQYGSSGHKDNYNSGTPGSALSSTRHDSFSDPQLMYSGFYTSALKNGTNATLRLNNPMGKDVLSWKASLSVTISYS